MVLGAKLTARLPARMMRFFWAKRSDFLGVTGENSPAPGVAEK